MFATLKHQYIEASFLVHEIDKKHDRSRHDSDSAWTEGIVEQKANKDIIKDYCERREGKLYTWVIWFLLKWEQEELI